MGVVAATEDEVYTTRLTDASFAADFNTLIVPAMVCGITAFGSGDKVKTDATWATPETPIKAEDQGLDAGFMSYLIFLRAA